MPDVTLTVDGQAVTVPEGATILQAAQSIGHAIPTICYHEACTPNAVCRMCVVEVEGARLLSPACVALVREGMAVRTRSERVERSRRSRRRTTPRRRSKGCLPWGPSRPRAVLGYRYRLLARARARP